MLMKIDTAGEISNLDGAQPEEVETAVSLASATDYHAEKFVLCRKFSHKN